MEVKQTWLLLTYKVPSEPSRKRVYVWRKLKEMGALYLQSGIGLLQETPEHLEMLEGLKKQILEMEGEAILARLSFPNSEDEEKVIQGFQESRNDEYVEIIEQCERLLDELNREEERGKYTFAEVEENESELEKLRKWIEKVRARDFFGASRAIEAQKIFAQAEKRLNAYIQKVYDKET